MSTWTIIHNGADVTQFAQVSSIQPSISGRNWVTGASFTFLTKDSNYGFACEDLIELRYGGTTMADGTIVAVERTYASDIPTDGAQAWKVTIQDVYRTLKERHLSLYDDKLVREVKESPAARISWLIDKIRATDSAAGNPHCLTSNKSQLTAGTATPGDDEPFDSPTFDADYRGKSYYDALNDTASMGEVDWKAIGLPATIRLTNALNPPTLAVEITDADDPSTVTPVSNLRTVIGGVRSMSITDDTAELANSIDVKYGGKNDQDKLTGTTGPNTRTTADYYVYHVENANSIAQYGRHEADPIEALEVRGWQKAKALGTRAIATTAWPQVRGNLRIKYDSRIKAGYYVWLHLVRHQDGSFIAQRKAMTLSVRPVFEKVSGVLRPIWLDVELGSDPFDPPTFTPAPTPPKPPKDPKPTVTTTTTTKPPQDGDVYISSLLLDHLSPFYGNPRHNGRVTQLPGGSELTPESWTFDAQTTNYLIRPSAYIYAWQTDINVNKGDWHHISNFHFWSNNATEPFGYEYSSYPTTRGIVATMSFVAPATGRYVFIYDSDDGREMYFDDTLVASSTGLNFYNGGTEPVNVSLQDFWYTYTPVLVAGTTHTIKLKYTDALAGGRVRFLWAAPGATVSSRLHESSAGYQSPFRAPSIGVANVPMGRTVRLRYHPRFGGNTLITRTVDQTYYPVALPFSELPSSLPLPALVVEVLNGGAIERQWPIAAVEPGMTFYYENPPADIVSIEGRPYLIEDGQQTASGSMPGVVVFSTGIDTTASISRSTLNLAVESRWADGRRVNRIAMRQIQVPSYTTTDAAGREAWWRQITGGSDSPWPTLVDTRYFTLADGHNRVSLELDPSKFSGAEHWVLPAGKWKGAVVIAPVGFDGPLDESDLDAGWPAIELGTGSGTASSLPTMYHVGPSLLTDPLQAGALDIKLVSPTSLATTTNHTLDFDPKGSLTGKGHSYVITQVGGTNSWTNTKMAEVGLPFRKGQTSWNFTALSGVPNFVPKTLRTWITYPTGRKVEITAKVKEVVASNGQGTGIDISKALPSGMTTNMKITIAYQVAS